MNTSPDIILPALKMVGALIFVLLFVIFIYYIARRATASTLTHPKGGTIRLLGNTYIGVKKSISLVEVPGALLVLGVTHDRINCLTKIEDPVLIEQVKKNDGKKERRPFADYLDRISQRVRSTKIENERQDDA